MVKLLLFEYYLKTNNKVKVSTFFLVSSGHSLINKTSYMNATITINITKWTRYNKKQKKRDVCLNNKNM